MKTITHDELLNQVVGEQGTPERTAFENELKAEVLAYRFKELRKQKKLTQVQLAQKSGIERSMISKIENGKFNLTIETINKIASVLGARINFNLEPI